MRTRTVNGVEVIECVHCSGSGICKHARSRTVMNDGILPTIKEIVMECSSCGTGMPGDKWRNGTKATPPTCRVCGGTGIYRG